MTVACGALMRDTDESRSPRLVVEVLSPSTSSFDRFRKLDEYRRHPVLRGILLADTRFPSVLLYWCRGEEPATSEAMTDSIDLPKIGVRHALADIDAAIIFKPGRCAP